MANFILNLLKGKPKGDFLELLKSRQSTYDYADKDIAPADLLTILEAGRWSPSFRNLQPWEFVVVKNRDHVQKLLETAHYGIYDFRKHTGIPPVVVALVLKKKYWEGEWGFPLTDKEGIFEAYMSVAMPAMNMALQAQELGIASCILNVRESLSYKLLLLNGGDCVPIVVCLGYEKPGAAEKKRERKELEEIVHSEYDTPPK